MNLTFAHHEESRYAGAVFDELTALLMVSGGAGEVVVRRIDRAPGPVNSQFAVSLEVESGRLGWTAEYAIPQWKDLPDRSPAAMARALAADIRTMLAAGPPADAAPRRRFFRRG